jgi:hypothetical protein
MSAAKGRRALDMGLLPNRQVVGGLFHHTIPDFFFLLSLFSNALLTYIYKPLSI